MSEITYLPLEIPSGKEINEKIRSRLRLIERFNLFPKKEIIELLNCTRDGDKSKIESLKKAILNRALKLRLNEFDLANLFYVYVYDTNYPLSDEQVARLNDHTEWSLKRSSAPRAEILSQGRSILAYTIPQLKKGKISEIRGKLAVLELLSLVYPNELIPILVEFSGQYLRSEVTVHWLHHQQYKSSFGNKDEKKASSKNLDSFLKAIKGDRRKVSKRKTEYWRAIITYENLAKWITHHRQLKKDGKFSKKDFDIFCNVWNVSEKFKNLIFSTSSPKTLILEIMTEQNLIDDPNAFKEFQAKINDIQKYEFGSVIAAYANDFIGISLRYLDIPATNPQVMARCDFSKLLENPTVSDRGQF